MTATCSIAIPPPITKNEAIATRYPGKSAKLNDPAMLAKCIPGCQKLELTAPNEMTATVVVKVGPVKANFSGKVTLSDIQAPNSYRISGEGSGGSSSVAVGFPQIPRDVPVWTTAPWRSSKRNRTSP